MPETRYIEVYDNQGNIIDHEPYTVSDEQLQDLADRATCLEYLTKSPDVITQPEIWWLLRYYGRLLGYQPG